MSPKDAGREVDDLVVIHAEGEEAREVARPIADIMTTAMYQPSGVLQEEEEEEDTATSVNGAGLKCLDEPNFAFDSSAQPPEATTQQKKPTYRVLEDPFQESTGDPMTTAMYDHSTSSAVSAGAAAGAPTARPKPSPKLGARPPATDIMEGAKEKLDRFWGSKSPGGGGGR